MIANFSSPLIISRENVLLSARNIIALFQKSFERLKEDYRGLEEADNQLTAKYEALEKENEAHWRQLTQILASNPEVFEQFCGTDEVEQDLIDNGYLIK